MSIIIGDTELNIIKNSFFLGYKTRNEMFSSRFLIFLKLIKLHNSVPTIQLKDNQCNYPNCLNQTNLTFCSNWVHNMYGTVYELKIKIDIPDYWNTNLKQEIDAKLKINQLYSKSIYRKFIFKPPTVEKNVGFLNPKKKRKSYKKSELENNIFDTRVSCSFQDKECKNEGIHFDRDYETLLYCDKHVLIFTKDTIDDDDLCDYKKASIKEIKEIDECIKNGQEGLYVERYIKSKKLGFGVPNSYLEYL
jgi:hypothetical protein